MEPVSGENGPEFTAGDVKKAANLSYRQLNEWAAKGVIPETRESETDWRKFDPKTIFTIMLLSELNERFGIAFEKLRKVREWMLEDGIDYFEHAQDLAIMSRMPIWLITDFEGLFVLDTEIEITEFLSHGLLHHDQSKFLAVVNITPVLNKLRSYWVQKDGSRLAPLTLDDSRIYEKMMRLRYGERTRDRDEAAVLKLIRERKYDEVTAHLRGGAISHLSVKEIIPMKERKARENQILDALKSADYQTVTVTQSGGHVVHLVREETVKVRGKTGTP